MLTWISVLSSQGGFLVSNSQSITANEYVSLLSSYDWPLKTSGAVQCGVPACDLPESNVHLLTRLSPKSLTYSIISFSEKTTMASFSMSRTVPSQAALSWSLQWVLIYIWNFATLLIVVATKRCINDHADYVILCYSKRQFWKER